MEHALVLASIIVGLGITDQIVSLNRLLAARRLVEWDWMAPAVAAVVLLTLVQVWGSLASEGNHAPTIGAFLPTLLELILLVLLSSATLPDNVPAEGMSLRQFYHDRGSYIWVLFSLSYGWVLVSGAAAALSAGASLLGVASSISLDGIALGVMVSLIFIRRRWWDAIALAILAVGPVGWLSRTIG